MHVINHHSQFFVALHDVWLFDWLFLFFLIKQAQVDM